MCAYVCVHAYMRTSLLDNHTLEEETKLNFIILFRNECSNLQISCMCVKERRSTNCKKLNKIQVSDFVSHKWLKKKSTVIDLFQATDKVSESNYVTQSVVKITKPVPNVYSQLVDFNVLSNAQKQMLF